MSASAAALPMTSTHLCADSAAAVSFVLSHQAVVNQAVQSQPPPPIQQAPSPATGPRRSPPSEVSASSAVSRVIVQPRAPSSQLVSTQQLRVRPEDNPQWLKLMQLRLQFEAEKEAAHERREHEKQMMRERWAHERRMAREAWERETAERRRRNEEEREHRERRDAEGRAHKERRDAEERAHRGRERDRDRLSRLRSDTEYMLTMAIILNRPEVEKEMRQRLLELRQPPPPPLSLAGGEGASSAAAEGPAQPAAEQQSSS